MRKLNVTEMNRMTVSEFRDAEKIPLIVILDNVRSMYNVGSIFRTCDAFRVEALWLCGITGCPPHPEIHKTALGAEESMEWKFFKDTKEAVSAVKEKGYKVYSIEQAEDSIKLGSNDALISLNSGCAIVLGHEVKGVAQDVVDMSDGCIEIPQYGTKHSLNVASAGAIIIHALSAPLCRQSLAE